LRRLSRLNHSLSSADFITNIAESSFRHTQGVPATLYPSIGLPDLAHVAHLFHGRSLLTLKRQGERVPPLAFCGHTLEDWDNEFRHPAFEKPNHRRTRSLSFVSLVRNFSRQRFEQNCV
jgi:hypothetical protein